MNQRLDSNSREFSPEEKDFLRRDAFIAEVMRQRDHGQRGLLSRFAFLLQSPVIVALIAGGFGAWITGIYQDGQKERDLEQANHALQTQLVDEVLTIVGTVRGNAESRIEIDGPKYARRMNAASERINADQKIAIRKEFNRAWQQWDTKKLSMLARIKFNLGEKSANEWAKLIVSVDSLMECASAHVPNTSATNLCQAQLDKATANADTFLSAIVGR